MYSRLFYKERAKDLDTHTVSIAAQKITAQNQPLIDDVKNFLLATSDYGHEIQSNIDFMLHEESIARQDSGESFIRLKKMFEEKKIHLSYYLRTFLILMLKTLLSGHF